MAHRARWSRQLPGAESIPTHDLSRPLAARDVPWRRVVGWAAASTALMATIVLVPFVMGKQPAVDLLRPGRQGPSVSVVRQDFPGARLAPGVGLDGQQYYAIARDPLHPNAVAQQLDRPRYRLQRPLLPVLVWLLHADGAGPGLLVAFVIIGVGALFLGSLATGALSTTLGGPASAAALFAVLPGAYLSLRFTLADSLALALAITTLTLSARGRDRAAVAVAILAVLARETTLLVFLGWWLAARSNRGRQQLLLAAGVTAGLWAVAVRVTVPAGAVLAGELRPPLSGLTDATRLIWAHGQEPLGMIITLGSIILGGVVLWRRGLGHPLAWVVAVNLAFVAVMGTSLVGLYFSSGRTMMPVLLFALLMVSCPGRRSELSDQRARRLVPRGHDAVAAT
jgi:hypothetical protein